MEVFVAVWYDRHTDDTYAIFTKKEDAINQCKEWSKYNYYSHYDFFEEEIKGWEYYLSAGDDMPKFHVEKVSMDKFEKVNE